MGMHLQTYLGPYFEFPNKKREILDNYDSCPKKGCKNHKKKRLSGNFCDQCGTQLVEVENKITHDYTLWDLDEEHPEMNIESRFWMPGETNVVISNGGYQINFGDDTEVDFADYDFNAIREKFIKDNGEALTLIHSKIGEVKVKFGIIQYYS